MSICTKSIGLTSFHNSLMMDKYVSLKCLQSLVELIRVWLLALSPWLKAKNGYLNVKHDKDALLG